MIRLRDVSLVYPSVGGVEVVGLAGVDLDVAAGEMVSVTGPSGSGKSTLLHVMAGLIRPSAGRVELLGRDLAQLGDDALTLMRRSEVGFVFQFFNLLPHLSAEENVAFPLLLSGTPHAEALERAREVLSQVDLAGRAAHRPEELSGGEMQRVAIARALLIRPRVLFADEPTGNLDSRTGEVLLGLLQRVHAETGTTVVMVTHNERIAALAPRCIRLLDGRVVADAGPARETRTA